MTDVIVPRDLPPTTLDELVAHAALLTRVDRKYVLHRDEAHDVLSGLSVHRAGEAPVRVLEVDGRREQTYESVYFDTPALLSYRLAAHGRRRRFKVRTRRYVDSCRSFVEVKTRGERGATVKERAPLDDAAARDDRTAGSAHRGGARARAAFPADRAAWLLTGPARAFADAALVRAGQESPQRLDLRPVLTVGYRRTTLYLPGRSGAARTDPSRPDSAWTVRARAGLARTGTAQAGVAQAGVAQAGVAQTWADRDEPSARATVDSDLSWLAADGTSLEIPDLVIVETKSGSRPSRIDRLLWSHGHRPARVSKFGTGMAVLDPRLPANRWSRAIRRLEQIAGEHP